MKAVVYDRYGGPEGLRLCEIPLPAPTAGEVRVKVSACAVNLSDWEYLVGSPFYARIVGGLWRPKQPILGSDIVGVIDALGPGVEEFQQGQRVFGDFVMIRGGFAEYACLPVSDMAPVPDGLSDEIAACLPQAGGIAVAGTEHLEENTRLLINGAGGGSGTMALQLARAAGAHVTTVDNAGKLDWLESLGADTVIDYAACDFTKAGERWDRILDMVATRGPSQIARSLTAGGTYQTLGGEVSVLLAIVLGGPWYRIKEKSIGMLLVPSGRELTRRVAELAVQGRLSPHIEAVLPLSSVPDALSRTGKGQVLGKLVIKP